MNKLYLSRSKIAFTVKRLLFLCITALCAIQLYAKPNLQVLVTLDAENMPITSILDKISKQTNVAIFQNNNQADLSKRVSVHFKNEPMNAVLDHLLEATNLSYKVENDLVVIIPAKEKPQEQIGRASCRERV